MNEDPWAGALCRNHDPNMWFLPQAQGNILLQRQAQRICEECPLRTACLEFALKNGEEFGVWGGLTAHDRHRLRRPRAERRSSTRRPPRVRVA